MKSYKKGFLFLVATTLKDITNYSLKQARVFSQEPIPLKASASFYSNASQYPRLVRNLPPPPHKQKKKTLKYYKLTDCQIHHLFKLQGIHQICCKVQVCLMHANPLSTINIMSNSMFKIFFCKTTTVQSYCIVFFQECIEISVFCKYILYFKYL